MEPQLERLHELQGLDSRIAGLEREIEAIPAHISAIRTEYQQAKGAVEAFRAKLDALRKDLRVREKDLDFQASQRAKCEAKLYEVKTNKEYSAVLAEIEALKLEKSRIEEEILGLMEAQERMTVEIREAESRLRRQEDESGRREAAASEELRVLEAEVSGIRGERESLARDIPQELADRYTLLLKFRAGLAVAVIGSTGICSGCRLALTPQRFQEVRLSSQIHTCESCGRMLYYQP